MKGWRVLLSHVEGDRELLACRHDLAERHQRRDPPLGRLRLALDVAQLLGQLACLAKHLESFREARGRARPVDPHEHRRQSEPVVDSACHRDRVRAREGRLLGVALELERASEACEQADTER